MLQFLSDFFSEVFLICIYPLSGIIVNFIPKKKFESTKDGRIIVIVERWLSFNIRHLYWKYYLERKGFRVFIKNFSLWDGDFKESGLGLKKYIEQKDLKDIILVGISGGAITSLLYLQEQDGWERVDKFVSIGAPFEGTWASVFVSFTHSGRELFPNSMLVQGIKKMRLLNIGKIFCIRAKFDEMVPSGSVLPGAGSLTLPVFGHNNLHLRIRATYRAIVEFAKDQRPQD